MRPLPVHLFRVTNRVMSPQSSSKPSCIPQPIPSSSCPQREVAVWHEAYRSGRLTNRYGLLGAKRVGEGDIVLESKSPLVPTALGQQSNGTVIEMNVGVAEMPEV